jgi:hypothetical protein
VRVAGVEGGNGVVERGRGRGGDDDEDGDEGGKEGGTAADEVSEYEGGDEDK